MPLITLPDGSTRQFDQPVTVAGVAASIGPGLAKAALAGRVDGQLVDTSFLIDDDADLAIVTCLLYTSPSPRDRTRSRMPSSA